MLSAYSVLQKSVAKSVLLENAIDSRMRIKTTAYRDLHQKPCQFYWHGLLHITISALVSLLDSAIILAIPRTPIVCSKVMETPYFTLALFAFLAGLVDSVVGGGGLIQIPALLVSFPSAPLALLFGTNKFAGVFGTAVATLRFMRAQPLPFATVMPSAVAAFIFSFLGARSVSLLNPEVLRPMVVLALVVVLIYTLFKPSIGGIHSPKLTPSKELLVGISIGGVLGFYDGFFGPGTGSFILFAFVALLGFDFIRASAASKVLNLATNVAALAFFIPNGYVRYDLGIVMAAANVLGSLVGVQLALTKGAGFVRVLFIVVVIALLAKQVHQLF